MCVIMISGYKLRFHLSGFPITNLQVDEANSNSRENFNASNRFFQETIIVRQFYL